MKFILVVTAFLLATACSNLQTTSLGNRTPNGVSSPELLREIIVNDSKNSALVRDVGRKCSQSLAEVYNEGKTLKSRVVESSLINLKSPAAKYCDKYTTIPLYHYTSSKYVIDNFSDLSKRNYLDLISYGRTKESNKPIISVNGFSNAIIGVLYVAMYPNTSTAYGDHLLTLFAKKDLKVVPRNIFNHFYRFGLVGAVSPELKKIMSELPSQVIENCNIADIALFVLEDSGADLVDYIPSNVSPETQYNENGWFYLLNAKSIESHSITSFSRVGADMREIEKIFKLENRDCELNR